MSKRQAKERDLGREQAQRLDQALVLRGFSVPQTARRAGLKREIVDDVLRGHSVSGAWGVLIAEALGVDPRWLLLGLPSAAGGAALGLALASKNFFLSGPQRRALTSFCAAIPEPDKGAGVCRYCLCTDELGCGDCTWVDEAHTICSACLEPEEL